MGWWLNPIELVFVAGSAGACMGAFVALVCSNMRMSRCKKITCCCLECIRENLSEEQYKEELENQHEIEHAAAAAPADQEHALNQN